jgi:hypothetical protein
MGTRFFARLSRAMLLLVAVATLTACGARSINQVLADPTRYANKDVKLQGQVVESYSVLGRGAYQIDDGTGRLWIVSSRGVPRNGARVQVKGKVRDGFNLGPGVSLPKGVESGMVLVASSHKAKD